MSIRIASREDYDQLRSTFRWQRPERFNFARDVFDHWAELQGDQPAIRWVSQSSERIVSYRQLADRSDRLAAALAARLERGSVVLIVLPRLVQWWETMLAVCKAGMVASPGTTLLTAGTCCTGCKRPRRPH